MPNAHRNYLQALRDYLHAICVAIGLIGIVFGIGMFYFTRGIKFDQYIDAMVVLAFGAAFLFGACLLKGPRETLRRFRRFLWWANKN